MLAKAGLRPKKRLGQNFLTNTAIAGRIAGFALEGAPPRARTIEIGAGTGVLTRALVDAGAQITAVEIDPELVAVLRSREDIAAAQIVAADALTFDYRAWSKGQPWRVAGNLPYNIATPLILRLIEMPSGPDSLTVMVQKDVAERFMASPGTRAYGSLSVAVQYAMRVEMLLTIGPQSFFPAPKVHSSVVRLTRRAEPAVTVRDLDLFWKVVRGAFAYRRKTLANSLALALHLERDAVARAIAASDLPAESRGEQLDLKAFCRLADVLAER